MAQRIVDMLKPVEVEHDQSAAAFGGFIRSEDTLQPFVHAVAVGKARQRVKFCQPRIDQLTFIFDGDVFRATAITLKFS